MVFLWLALVAWVFGALGFLAHAYYFDKQERVFNLEREIDSMTRIVALHDQARTEAEARSVAATSRIKSLESKLAEQIEQRNALRARVEECEDELRKLREATSELQVSVTEIVEPKNVLHEGKAPAQAEGEGIDRKIPRWKDKLNSILNTLDKIEREREG
jgi:chromosome segregation ATPase